MRISFAAFSPPPAPPKTGHNLIIFKSFDGINSEMVLQGLQFSERSWAANVGAVDWLVANGFLARRWWQSGRGFDQPGVIT